MWEKGLSLHLLALCPGSSCRHPHLCLPALSCLLGAAGASLFLCLPSGALFHLRLPSPSPRRSLAQASQRPEGPARGWCPGGPAPDAVLLSPTCPLSCLRPCARAGPWRPSCSCVLCTVLLSLAVLLAVAATSADAACEPARARARHAARPSSAPGRLGPTARWSQWTGPTARASTSW